MTHLNLSEWALRHRSMVAYLIIVLMVVITLASMLLISAFISFYITNVHWGMSLNNARVDPQLFIK